MGRGANEGATLPDVERVGIDDQADLADSELRQQERQLDDLRLAVEDYGSRKGRETLNRLSPSFLLSEQAGEEFEELISIACHVALPAAAVRGEMLNLYALTRSLEPRSLLIINDGMNDANKPHLREMGRLGETPRTLCGRAYTTPLWTTPVSAWRFADEGCNDCREAAQNKENFQAIINTEAPSVDREQVHRMIVDRALTYLRREGLAGETADAIGQAAERETVATICQLAAERLLSLPCELRVAQLCRSDLYMPRPYQQPHLQFIAEQTRPFLEQGIWPQAAELAAFYSDFFTIGGVSYDSDTDLALHLSVLDRFFPEALDALEQAGGIPADGFPSFDSYPSFLARERRAGYERLPSRILHG